jgi:RimJ/RimL family protein N-acetyltransferase
MLHRAALACIILDESDAPVGDLEIFLNDPEDRSVAEIGLMIAEPAARRRGIGSEAVALAMDYGEHYIASARRRSLLTHFLSSPGHRHLGLATFRAIIAADNAPSIAMFAKLGYVETARNTTFGEVTLTHHVCTR